MYFQLCPLLDRNKNRSQEKCPTSPYTALFVKVWLQTVQKYPRNSVKTKMKYSSMFSLVYSSYVHSLIRLIQWALVQYENVWNDNNFHVWIPAEGEDGKWWGWLLMFCFLVFFYGVAIFLSSSFAFTFYSMHLNAAALDHRAILYHISRKQVVQVKYLTGFKIK